MRAAWAIPPTPSSAPTVQQVREIDHRATDNGTVPHSVAATIAISRRVIVKRALLSPVASALRVPYVARCSANQQMADYGCLS